MSLPTLPQGASVLVTAGAGAFVAYIASTCQVSPVQLLSGAAMAAGAAIIHLYMDKPAAKDGGK